MANGKSLLDAVKEYLTPDVLQKMSSHAGETPGNTSRAIDSIVPTLLYGTAKLADSPGGENQLIKLIGQQAGDGNILNNLAGKLSGGNATESFMGSGQGILTGLFGNKLDSVVDTIARSLGLKSSSISSLLSIAAPLVLGVLGKEKSAGGLGAGGLASLLTGQKSTLSQMVPAGLGGLLGWSDVGRTEERVVESSRYQAPRPTYETTRERRSNWWIYAVVGLAALGFLLYSYWPRRAIAPEETIATRETLQESRPALQEAKPVQEALPVPEKPIVSQSSEDTLAAGKQNEPVGYDLRQVQKALKNRGQDPGPIDGIMGPRTEQALRRFQETNSLEQTGVVDEATRQKLANGR